MEISRFEVFKEKVEKSIGRSIELSYPFRFRTYLEHL